MAVIDTTARSAGTTEMDLMDGMSDTPSARPT
jgi:hypothetical protein